MHKNIYSHVHRINWDVTDRGICFDEAEDVLLKAYRDILVERGSSADVMHFAKYDIIYSKFQQFHRLMERQCPFKISGKNE